MQKRHLAIIAVLLSVIGMALKAIFVKLTLAEVADSFTVVGYRAILSLPFFLIIYVMFKRKEGQVKSNLLRVGGCAILFYLAVIFDTLGLERIPVSIERTLLSMLPIYVLVLSRLFLKKTYSVSIYIAVAISWLGMGLSFLSGETIGDVDFVGVGYVMLSVLTYSVYLLLSMAELKTRNALVFNAQMMMMSCAISIIPVLFYSHFNLSVLLPAEGQWTAPLCLALISTVLPSFLNMYGMKYVGPIVVSACNNIGPFITTLAGFFILSEPVSLFDITSMGIVLGSVYYIGKHKEG